MAMDVQSGRATGLTIVYPPEHFESTDAAMREVLGPRSATTTVEGFGPVAGWTANLHGRPLRIVDFVSSASALIMISDLSSRGRQRMRCWRPAQDRHPQGGAACLGHTRPAIQDGRFGDARPCPRFEAEDRLSPSRLRRATAAPQTRHVADRVAYSRPYWGAKLDRLSVPQWPSSWVMMWNVWNVSSTLPSASRRLAKIAM